MTLRYLFCVDLGVMLACHPDLARAVTRPSLALGAAMVLFVTDRLALSPYLQLDLFRNALGSLLLLAGLLGSAGSGPSAFSTAPRCVLGAFLTASICSIPWSSIQSGSWWRRSSVPGSFRARW